MASTVKKFEAMKAGKLAIWPKSQFHKNLPPRDFSIMTLLLASSFHSVKDNCPESKEQQHNTAIYFYFCCCITYCGILYLYRTIARRVGSDTIAPRGGGGGDDGGSHSAICSLLRDQ